MLQTEMQTATEALAALREAAVAAATTHQSVAASNETHVATEAADPHILKHGQEQTPSLRAILPVSEAPVATRRPLPICTKRVKTKNRSSAVKPTSRTTDASGRRTAKLDDESVAKAFSSLKIGSVSEIVDGPELSAWATVP